MTTKPRLIYAMSPEDFDKAAAAIQGRDPRVEKKSVEIARAVLVDQRTLGDVAEQFAVTKTRVSYLRNRYNQVHLSLQGYPPGWETMAVTAHPEDLRRFMNETEQKRRKWIYGE